MENDVKRLDPNNPMPGDIISARYRWSNQDDDVPGEKIRPCLVIKVGKNAESLIVAPLSTREDQKVIDCVEIPPQERKAAGLNDRKRSWVKLTEVNKVELPNLAIIPHTDQHGRLSWRRGRVSDDVFKQVTAEIGLRIHDKSLKGMTIKKDANARISLRGVRKVEPESKNAHVGAEIARSRILAPENKPSPEKISQTTR